MLGKSGVYQSTAHSALKTARKNIEPLKNAARIRFAQECWLPDLCATIMGDERDGRLFALAALNWYHSHAC